MLSIITECTAPLEFLLKHQVDINPNKKNSNLHPTCSVLINNMYNNDRFIIRNLSSAIMLNIFNILVKHNVDYQDNDQFNLLLHEDNITRPLNLFTDNSATNTTVLRMLITYLCYQDICDTYSFEYIQITYLPKTGRFLEIISLWNKSLLSNGLYTEFSKLNNNISSTVKKYLRFKNLNIFLEYYNKILAKSSRNSEILQGNTLISTIGRELVNDDFRRCKLELDNKLLTITQNNLKLIPYILQHNINQAAKKDYYATPIVKTLDNYLNTDDLLRIYLSVIRQESFSKEQSTTLSQQSLEISVKNPTPQSIKRK